MEHLLGTTPPASVLPGSTHFLRSSSSVGVASFYSARFLPRDALSGASAAALALDAEADTASLQGAGSGDECPGSHGGDECSECSECGAHQPPSTRRIFLAKKLLAEATHSFSPCTSISTSKLDLGRANNNGALGPLLTMIQGERNVERLRSCMDTLGFMLLDKANRKVVGDLGGLALLMSQFALHASDPALLRSVLDCVCHLVKADDDAKERVWAHPGKRQLLALIDPQAQAPHLLEVLCLVRKIAFRGFPSPSTSLAALASMASTSLTTTGGNCALLDSVAYHLPLRQPQHAQREGAWGRRNTVGAPALAMLSAGATAGGRERDDCAWAADPSHSSTGTPALQLSSASGSALTTMAQGTAAAVDGVTAPGAGPLELLEPGVLEAVAALLCSATATPAADAHAPSASTAALPPPPPVSPSGKRGPNQPPHHHQQGAKDERGGFRQPLPVLLKCCKMLRWLAEAAAHEHLPLWRRVLAGLVPILVRPAELGGEEEQEEDDEGACERRLHTQGSGAASQPPRRQQHRHSASFGPGPAAAAAASEPTEPSVLEEREFEACSLAEAVLSVLGVLAEHPQHRKACAELGMVPALLSLLQHEQARLQRRRRWQHQQQRLQHQRSMPAAHHHHHHRGAPPPSSPTSGGAPTAGSGGLVAAVLGVLRQLEEEDSASSQQIYTDPSLVVLLERWHAASALGDHPGGGDDSGEPCLPPHRSLGAGSATHPAGSCSVTHVPSMQGLMTTGCLDCIPAAVAGGKSPHHAASVEMEGTLFGRLSLEGMAAFSSMAATGPSGCSGSAMPVLLDATAAAAADTSVVPQMPPWPLQHVPPTAASGAAPAGRQPLLPPALPPPLARRSSDNLLLGGAPHRGCPAAVLAAAAAMTTGGEAAPPGSAGPLKPPTAEPRYVTHTQRHERGSSSGGGTRTGSPSVFSGSDASSTTTAAALTTALGDSCSASSTPSLLPPPALIALPGLPTAVLIPSAWPPPPAGPPATTALPVPGAATAAVAAAALAHATGGSASVRTAGASPLWAAAASASGGCGPSLLVPGMRALSTSPQLAGYAALSGPVFTDVDAMMAQQQHAYLLAEGVAAAAQLAPSSPMYMTSGTVTAVVAPAAQPPPPSVALLLSQQQRAQQQLAHQKLHQEQLLLARQQRQLQERASAPAPALGFELAAAPPPVATGTLAAALLQHQQHHARHLGSGATADGGSCPCSATAASAAASEAAGRPGGIVNVPAVAAAVSRPLASRPGSQGELRAALAAQTLNMVAQWPAAQGHTALRREAWLLPGAA